MSEYVTVKGRVAARTPQAICLLIEGDEHWVPRSCMEDGGHDVDVAWDADGYMTEVETEVAAWKAKELGL